MNDLAPAFSVRPANLGDAAGAVDALRNSITYLCVEDHQNDAATLAHWLRNKTVEHFERWLLDPTNFVAVGDDGAQVYGVGLIDQSGHVRLCYVRSDRQRIGVGGALLSALEGQASSWGLNEIRLTSSATARGFYEKQGYVSDGESVQAFGVARGYPYRKCLLKRAVQLTKDSWSCPKCHRVFTQVNQRHACGTGSREEVLRNRPAVLVDVYELIEAYAKTLGPIEIVTRQRYALFRSARIFADLTVMTSCVRLVIHLRRRVADPAFSKIVTGEKTAVSHVAKLATPDEWKAVKSYFEEAYRVSL